MSEKINILTDYFGRLLLNEIRGISFEVRAWAQIIKNVIESEYKNYFDYDIYSPKTKDSLGLALSTKNNGDNLENKKKITKADLAVMSQQEIDNILNVVMDFYKLSHDKVVDADVDKIVTLYNRAIDSGKFNKKETTIQTFEPDQIIINGRDYPEIYAKFSVDKWVISNKYPTEYDHRKSGYQDNGEYVVFINTNLANPSLFALTHEIKHAYQDWQRMSKGKPPIRDSKELQQLYTKDFEDYIITHKADYDLKTLNSVILAYYMSSDAEIAAFLEGVYDDLRGNSEHPQIADKFIKLGKNMANFKASQVEPNMPPELLQKRWTQIITNYDIPLFRKFKNVFDFLKYTERRFNEKGRYILKKVNKLRTV